MTGSSRWTHDTAILLYSSFGALVVAALCIGFIPYRSYVFEADSDSDNFNGWDTYKNSVTKLRPYRIARDIIDKTLDDVNIDTAIFFGLAMMLGIFILIFFALIITSVLKCTLSYRCTRNNKHLHAPIFEIVHRTLLGLDIMIYIPAYLVHVWPVSFVLDNGATKNVLWATGCYMGMHALSLGIVALFVMLIGPPILYSNKPSMSAVLYILSVALVGCTLFGFIVFDILQIGIPYPDLLTVCYIHVPTVCLSYSILYIFTLVNKKGCTCGCGNLQRIESVSSTTNVEQPLMESSSLTSQV